MEIKKYEKYEVKEITTPDEYISYVDIQSQRSSGDINQSKFIQDLIRSGYFSMLNHTDNIIDIGCRGNAQVVKDLLSMGYTNVYGIDIGYAAEEMWKKFDEQLQSRLRRYDVHHGIGFDIKFKCITSSHTLEHCFNPERVITILRDSLEDDGIIHLQIPLSNYDEYIRHSPHYAYWDSQDNFKSWLSDLGLNVVFSEKRSYLDDFAVILTKK
jgi:2-polyprenyl-3-methyl-5-hydroxy-6-metoxy-1,4-benzoquinol methylase